MPISDDDKEQVRNYIITEPFTTLLESNRQQIDRQQQITRLVRSLRNIQDLNDLNRFISATRETHVSRLQWQAIGKRVAQEMVIIITPFLFAFLVARVAEVMVDTENWPDKSVRSAPSTSPEIIAGFLGFFFMRAFLRPYVQPITAEDPPAVTRLKNRASFVENLIQEKILELASANESSSQLHYRHH